MTIFKYEMKQLRGSVIIWSASLAIAIILMLPVYIDMVTGTAIEISIDTFAGHGVFDALGTNIEILITPLGTYSFLTSFVLFACAINGMNMGLKIFTKEYLQNTADFLLTKPHSRKKVFFSKLFAAATSAVIIGGIYSLASWAGMLIGTNEDFSIPILAQIALTTIYMQLLFLTMGMLIATLTPRIRTPIGISAGVAFFTYVIGSFSRMVGIDFLGYFSPYLYFNGAGIISTGGYEPRYMILFVALIIAFTATSYIIFRKKDIILVS